MRHHLALAFSLSVPALFGQWAIGAHIGLADDHAESTNTPSFGLQVEHRFSDSSRFSYRLSFDAIGLPHRGSHMKVVNGEGQLIGFQEQRSARERLGCYLEARYALTRTECTNGFFRGAYAVGGIAWLGTWATEDRWFEDPMHVREQAIRTETFSSSLRSRLGAGAQWSFPWGALFGEVLITLGNDKGTADRSVLLSSLGVQAGYRYVLRRKD